MGDKRKLINSHHESSDDNITSGLDTPLDLATPVEKHLPSVSLAADDKAFIAVNHALNKTSDVGRNRAMDALEETADRGREKAVEKVAKELKEGQGVGDNIKNMIMDTQRISMENEDILSSGLEGREKELVLSVEERSGILKQTEDFITDRKPEETNHHSPHVEFVDETKQLDNLEKEILDNSALTEEGDGKYPREALVDPETRDMLSRLRAEQSEISRQNWAKVRASFLANHRRRGHHLNSGGDLTGDRPDTRGLSQADGEWHDGTDSELGDHPGPGMRGSRARLADELEEEEEVQEQNKTGETDIKSAIPYLPRRAAVLCLLLNIFIPGTGTMLSGVLGVCCGKSRISQRDAEHSSTVCINFMVGVMQLITVTFMLVGWVWSLVWGIYIVILAAEYRKEKKIKHDKELKAKVLVALNKGIRQWQLNP